MRTVISCEHGGNEIPAGYRSLFSKAGNVLETHRGYDIGALEIFRSFEVLADYSCHSLTSRLLVELNRSLHHPKLFSEYSKPLPEAEKKNILEHYYLPYRQSIEKQIGAYINKKEKVLHISVHTFTPVLKGRLRNADIGLLYDPARPEEKSFCNRWKNKIRELDPSLRVSMNYPYKGTADGLTTYLRKKFPERYTGIELEVNQAIADDSGVIEVLLSSFGNS